MADSGELPNSGLGRTEPIRQQSHKGAAKSSEMTGRQIDKLKLFHTISKAVSPLFVFHCSPCNHTTTKQHKPFVERLFATSNWRTVVIEHIERRNGNPC